MLATQLLVLYRSRALAGDRALLFDEEDPHAIFQGFQLSEGLAAAPKPDRGQPGAGEGMVEGVQGAVLPSSLPPCE